MDRPWSRDSFESRRFRLVLTATLGFCVSMSACHSSLQKPSNDDPLAEVDGGVAEIEVLDGPDNRRLPYLCEGDTECDDNDICTNDTCVDSKCRYRHKEINFKPEVLETAMPALDVLVTNTRLVVAEGEGGLELYLRGDPEPPEFEIAAETEKPALAIEMIDYELAVCEGENGIETFMGAPIAPGRHIEADTGFLHGIDDVRGYETGQRFSFASGYADGVIVYDISDVNNPSPIKVLPTNGRAMRTASTGHAALTADALGGVAVIAFDTPDGIMISKQIPTTGRVLDVDLASDTGIVAEYGGGFSVLDLSNPELPTRLVNYPTASPVTMVGLIGTQTAIVGDETGHLRLFDIRVQHTGGETTADDGTVVPKATAAAPVELDTWTGDGVPVRMVEWNGVVAIAMSEGGVAWIDTGCMPVEE